MKHVGDAFDGGLIYNMRTMCLFNSAHVPVGTKLYIDDGRATVYINDQNMQKLLWFIQDIAESQYVSLEELERDAKQLLKDISP
jgi:hypothetical protein